MCITSYNEEYLNPILFHIHVEHYWLNSPEVIKLLLSHVLSYLATLSIIIAVFSHVHGSPNLNHHKVAGSLVVHRCVATPSWCLPQKCASYCEVATSPSLRLPLDCAHLPLERLVLSLRRGSSCRGQCVPSESGCKWHFRSCARTQGDTHLWCSNCDEHNATCILIWHQSWHPFKYIPMIPHVYFMDSGNHKKLLSPPPRFLFTSGFLQNLSSKIS